VPQARVTHQIKMGLLKTLYTNPWSLYFACDSIQNEWYCAMLKKKVACKDCEIKVENHHREEQRQREQKAREDAARERWKAGQEATKEAHDRWEASQKKAGEEQKRREQEQEEQNSRVSQAMADLAKSWQTASDLRSGKDHSGSPSPERTVYDNVSGAGAAFLSLKDMLIKARGAFTLGTQVASAARKASMSQINRVEHGNIDQMNDTVSTIEKFDGSTGQTGSSSLYSTRGGRANVLPSPATFDEFLDEVAQKDPDTAREIRAADPKHLQILRNQWSQLAPVLAPPRTEAGAAPDPSTTEGQGAGSGETAAPASNTVEISPRLERLFSGSGTGGSSSAAAGKAGGSFQAQREALSGVSHAPACEVAYRFEEGQVWFTVKVLSCAIVDLEIAPGVKGKTPIRKKLKVEGRPFALSDLGLHKWEPGRVRVVSCSPCPVARPDWLK